MRLKYLIYLFVIVLLSSCGEYEKLLKSSDYQLKYEKAFEYYEDEEYVRSATIFEQIANIYNGTNKADTLQFYRAYSYFHQRDYYMAGHYFEELIKTFPSSDFAEEASFMNGYCYYMLSPRPSLDQASTYKAITTLTMFKMNFPASERIDEANRIIREMEEKLVEKSYISAKLYYDLSKYQSAIIALRNSLGQFPDTKYREELMFMILESSYQIAANSVEDKKTERYQATVDEYYSFIGEFPEGEFAGDAERIYRTSMDALGMEIN